jgi:hypothetical protein
MAENKETQQPVPDLTIPEMRHEHRDVNVWAIGKIAIALALLTIASIFLMFGVFRYFEVRENANQAPLPPAAIIQSNKLPPQPRLLDNEPQDLQEYRADQDKALSTYGWVDQQHGVVRIPISRAMDLLVQRGFPARPQAGPGFSQSAKEGATK